MYIYTLHELHYKLRYHIELIEMNKRTSHIFTINSKVIDIYFHTDYLQLSMLKWQNY